MDHGADSYRRFRDCGDEAGLDELIRTYRDGLTLYLASIVGSMQTAEELAEDTFVLLGVRKPLFKGKSTFRTWLYTIGRHIAADYYRKQARHIRVSMEELPRKPPRRSRLSRREPRRSLSPLPNPKPHARLLLSPAETVPACGTATSRPFTAI